MSDQATVARNNCQSLKRGRWISAAENDARRRGRLPLRRGIDQRPAPPASRPVSSAIGKSRSSLFSPVFGHLTPVKWPVHRLPDMNCDLGIGRELNSVSFSSLIFLVLTKFAMDWFGAAMIRGKWVFLLLHPLFLLRSA